MKNQVQPKIKTNLNIKIILGVIIIATFFIGIAFVLSLSLSGSNKRLSNDEISGSGRETPAVSINTLDAPRPDWMSEKDYQGVINNSKKFVHYISYTGSVKRVDAIQDNYIQGELLVKFSKKSGIISESKAISYLQSARALGNIQIIDVKQLVSLTEKNSTSGVADVYKIRLSLDKNIAETAAFLEEDSNIDIAQPNYVYYTSFVPNDPDFSQQWVHQKMQSESAWDMELGDPNIKLAILDTGVDYTHEDLADNMLPGYDFVDLTGSEYEQVCATDEDCYTEDSDPMDVYGHGTHVAGIAAAKGNNNIGISGICPECSIMPIRVGWKMVDGRGALLDEDIYQGLVYAADHGANVINMSFEGSGSSIMEQGITYARNAGVVLVAAAGNGAVSLKSYPAGYESVISVAATDEFDKRAFFSNWGSWVDIAAPGVNIYSTLPGNNYGSYDGTSMAAPQIVGIIGLLLSHQPAMTDTDIRNSIHSGIDDLDESIYIGTGRINAFASLQFNGIANAKIASSMDDNVYVTNSIENIYGSANGLTFSSYSVDYGESAYPTTWTVLVSDVTTPISDGILAQFDTTQLTEGQNYTIRVKVVALNGQITEDRAYIRKNYVDNGQDMGDLVYQLNDPLESFTTQPILFDLNQDGQKEYIVASGHTETFEDSGVYVFDQQGNDIGIFPYKSRGGFVGSPAIADLDGDGNYEIIILGQDTYLYAFHYNGTIMFKRQISFESGSWVTQAGSPSISDIDGNGSLEIIVVIRGKRYILNADGSDYSAPITYSQGISDQTVSLGDIYDGDGIENAFFVSYNASPNINERYTEVHVQDIAGLDNFGFPVVHDWPYHTAPLFSAIGLFNIDQTDSHKELLIGNAGSVTAVDNETGDILPGFPVDEGISESFSRTTPIIVDLDNDGIKEMVYAGGDLFVWSMADPKNPVLRFKVPAGVFSGANGASLYGITVGDVTGDGHQEIIVRDSCKSKLVFVFDADGNIIPSFPRYVYTGVSNECTFVPPVYTDVEGDGNANIVTVGWGRIYNLNLIGVTLRSDWPYWYHDAWNTLNSDTLVPPDVCGNTDGIVGPSGPVDVADLSYLIAYLWENGPPPYPLATGNIDGEVGPSGPIDVADLSYLTAYLFQGGAPPCAPASGYKPLGRGWTKEHFLSWQQEQISN